MVARTFGSPLSGCPGPSAGSRPYGASASRRDVEHRGLARGGSAPLRPHGLPRHWRRGGGRGPPLNLCPRPPRRLSADGLTGQSDLPRPAGLAPPGRATRARPLGGPSRCRRADAARRADTHSTLVAARELRASARALLGIEGASPSSAPLYPQRVSWLSHLTVAQASPASRPRRRWPGCRGQAARPHGRWGQRATRHFLATAALAAAQRFPPYPYPSETRDRRSQAIPRPVGYPKCLRKPRKPPLWPWADAAARHVRCRCLLPDPPDRRPSPP